MKNKINIFIGLLYTSAFMPFLAGLFGLNGSILSLMALVIDIIIFYLGFSALILKKFNYYILLIIILISLFTFLTHKYSLISHLNGLREFLDIVLLFSFYQNLAVSRFRFFFIKRMTFFFICFLIIQIPIAFYQFLKFGAGDYVVGSLGMGSSGILSLIIILIVYFMIKMHLNGMKFVAYSYLIFLFPIFVNETKISFILLPIMLLLLSNVKRISTIIFSIAISVFVFFLFNNFYSNQGRKVDDPFHHIFSNEYLEKYLLGPEVTANKDAVIDIPRFTKIVIAMQLLGKDELEAFYGMEYGAFKGGTIMNKSSFSREYDWLLKGSRPYLFYLLITGGWLLFFVIFFYFYIQLCTGFGKLCDKRLAILCGIILIIVMFYNDSPRQQFFVMIYAFFVTFSKGYSKLFLLRMAKNTNNLLDNSVKLI